MTEHLFQPLSLPCGTVIRNRFLKSAMSEGLGDRRHHPSPLLPVLYRTWAAGGTGLLITGNVMIRRDALGEPRNVVLDASSDLEPFRAWAAAGTAGGTQLWMQLNHPGKQSPRMLSREPVAPSAIPLGGDLKPFFAPPRALTEAEILDLVAGFAASARLAQQAGFTGVQIHGAHGYLVSQFLSPRHNQREDSWGGSPERRMRFPLEVYRAIRQAVGPAFPVGIKLNSADFQRGGFTEAESLDVVRALDREGIDLIEISGGTYENPVVMSGDTRRESTRQREAYFLFFAEQVKRLATCPVAVTGGFRSAAAMAEALAAGATDLIGLARPLAVRPDLPAQIRSGLQDPCALPRIRTGIRALDERASLFDIMWYAQQLRRMGQGKQPRQSDAGLLALLGIMARSGLEVFGRQRS